MKVLIVNNSDSHGGAAVAALRLHKALLEQGINSLMLVQNKQTLEPTVIASQNAFAKITVILRQYLELLPVRFYKERTRILFSPNWLPFSGIVKKIQVINPDIVHLHWTHLGMMNSRDLLKINLPIVWTLHDNWGFTGGCHVKWDCDNYLKSCGFCPRLGSSVENDLSRRVWKRKKYVYNKKPDITFVALSSWLCEIGKRSSLLGEKTLINLPNPINTLFFDTFNKEQARKLLNLPVDKKLIVFGAVSATSDVNKGFSQLFDSLKFIDTVTIELVVFGSSKPLNGPVFNQKTIYLGQLNDEISLRLLYNSADVVVVPSLQENLSNVIMESLACGTPVAAFNVGGNKDMIDHNVNGYLAIPFDPEDLANGINWVLDHDDPALLSSNARKKVLENFDSSLVAKRYIELYKSVLGESV